MVELPKIELTKELAELLLERRELLRQDCRGELIGRELERLNARIAGAVERSAREAAPCGE